jgi:MFS family permease
MASTYESPTGWYRELDASERRTFWACFGGWMLDAMDVQIFSFVIPAIIAAFAITNADAGLIGTVTLLTSAFGGWFGGALSDRFGRVRTLQITIAWFAIFTFLCGFAQNYTQLFVFRALMGLGFGGEWAAGAVLMGEVIRPEHRGKAVGSVQSGWAVGWGIAAIAATWFFSVLPQDTAWRALFWVGLLPAFLVFFIRRFVDEPKVFTATQTGLIAKGARANFMEIFSPGMLRTTILTSRCTGRLLRHCDMASDLSAHRAKANRARYRRLPCGHYRRLLRRLSRQRVPCRSDRASGKLHPVCGLLSIDGVCLYPASGQ